MATCLNKAEDKGDLILRLYECIGNSATASLSFGFKVKRIEETEIIERPLGVVENKHAEKTKAKTTVQNAEVKIRFKPYEIKTIRTAVSNPAVYAPPDTSSRSLAALTGAYPPKSLLK